MQKINKKKSLSWWKKKAVKIHSNYIRMMAANPDGYAECVTCGVVKHWKNLQNGHFIPGRGNSVLFADHNCHPQCYVCNCILKGNWVAYYEFMKKNYGLEVIEHLMSLKKQIKIMTIEDYKNIIDLYGGIKEK